MLIQPLNIIMKKCTLCLSFGQIVLASSITRQHFSFSVLFTSKFSNFSFHSCTSFSYLNITKIFNVSLIVPFLLKILKKINIHSLLHFHSSLSNTLQKVKTFSHQPCLNTPIHNTFFHLKLNSSFFSPKISSCC